MKNSGYIDYTKASDYYNDKKEEILKNDLETIEKEKKFFVWVQEFSKKVVSIVFFIYIMVSILICILTCYAFFNLGDSSPLQTLISEINSTFRDTVGAYCIKAGLENVSKIIGNYYVGVADANLKATKERLKNKSEDYANSDSEEEETDPAFEDVNIGDDISYD